MPTASERWSISRQATNGWRTTPKSARRRLRLQTMLVWVIPNPMLLTESVDRCGLDRVAIDKPRLRDVQHDSDEAKPGRVDDVRVCAYVRRDFRPGVFKRLAEHLDHVGRKRRPTDELTSPHAHHHSHRIDQLA